MEKSIDLQTFDDEFRQRVKSSASDAKAMNGFDRDKYELARAGKEQVLKASEQTPTLREAEMLTTTATLRLGFHDRIILWSYVHLGKHISVGFASHICQITI